MFLGSTEAAYRKCLASLPDIVPFLVSVLGLKVPSLVSLGALEAQRCRLHREQVTVQRGQEAKLRSPSQLAGVGLRGVHPGLPVEIWAQPGMEPRQQGRGEAGRRQDHTGRLDPAFGSSFPWLPKVMPNPSPSLAPPPDFSFPKTVPEKKWGEGSETRILKRP